jgi:Family of unknown function (DUF6152)
MKTKFFVVVVAACALTFSSPVLGHHFFPKESDKTISLKGKVTGFEWVNPHSRFFMDVTDNAGKVTNWEIELGSPLALTHRGWTQDSLRFGDVVTVDVIRWKGRANVGVARDLVFPDGRKVFAGSHAGDTAFEKP